MIPTAKETYLNSYKDRIKGCVYIEDKHGNKFIREDLIESVMIEFAKLHVKEALKQASDKALVSYPDRFGRTKSTVYYADNGEVYADFNSILNAYPEELIK